MNAIIENCQGEIEELKSSQEDYDALKSKYGNIAEELDDARSELKKLEGVKEELVSVSSKVDSLQRERERYNATVKALKVDLRALHQENAGPETSLQEHMRILNGKWQDSVLRLEKMRSLEDDLAKSLRLLEDQERERERESKDYESRLNRLSGELEGTQSELIKVSFYLVVEMWYSSCIVCSDNLLSSSYCRLNVPRWSLTTSSLTTKPLSPSTKESQKS
jgi:chromosome segregation ATPase